MSAEEKNDNLVKVEGRFINRWGEKALFPQLKGKIDFAESVAMLVNKVMDCSAEDFKENTHRLYNSLPSSWLDDEFLDEVPDCNDEVEDSVPIMNCGIPVDESICPPKVTRKTVTDFHKLFGLILDLLDRRNLLVSKERHEYMTSERIKNKGETPRDKEV